MESQNLQAFIRVAEEHSFSRAASRLHLTQPAVSKRIALLEQQLDCRLFDRIGRRVSLTEAGRALLPHAEAVVQQLMQAQRAVRDLSGEVAGQLRLATSHHIGLHRLPRVLSLFSQRYQAVHLDIDFMDSEQAYEMIVHGQAELAVVTLAPETDANIITRPVWRDPLDVMVARDHALASLRPCPIAALVEHAAVLPGLNTYTGQIVKRLFEQRGLPLQVSMATNYLETIRMLASVGLGWTVLPRNMCDHTLLPLAIEGVRIERTLGLVYHRGRSLSRAARAFIDVLEPDPDIRSG